MRPASPPGSPPGSTPPLLHCRLSDAPEFPPLPVHDKLQTQDVGQAFADFLRFAEELQQRLAPGASGWRGRGSGPKPGPALPGTPGLGSSSGAAPRCAGLIVGPRPQHARRHS